MSVLTLKTYEQSARFSIKTAQSPCFLHKYLGIGKFCGIQDTAYHIGVTDTETKNMFRSLITASTHILFIHNCFTEINTPEGKYLTVKNADI